MKHSPFTKVLAGILCAVMLLGVIPLTAFAADTEGYQSETHDVFKHIEQTLAPGVTNYTNYAYTSDGKQMVYYVTTADLTRDDVIAQVAYKDMQNDEYGMSKLSDMVTCANSKYSDPTNEQFISEYYNVVSACNGDGYNMSTGEPNGIFIMGGNVKKGFNGRARTFLAILNDGSAVIDQTQAAWDACESKGISEAISVFGTTLVWDGKDITASASGTYNTQRHSRTMVGVTADGKLVICSVDGRQEPFSCGASMHELAQIMLEAGCVRAFNLDGGGSTTFMAKDEGTDDCTVINRPSDGSERAISNGIIIASTAKPSNVFERATLTAESDYVTPHSAVKFTAKGVSSAGTSANIPDDVTVQLKDSSMGTISDNTFISNGTVGDAVIQMVYNGNVVGETTVHVVIPDIAFTSTSMTIPYGKTFTLSVVGTTNNGLNSVTMKTGDIKFELSNSEMGVVTGNSYTTCAEDSGITDGTIIAKCVWDETKTDTATVKFGKASEIVWDFEDGQLGSWWATTAHTDAGSKYGRFEKASVSIVDETTGKVRNGKYAMAVTADFSDTTASGYKGIRFQLSTSNKINLADSTAFGMWIYLPAEANALELEVGTGKYIYHYYPEKDSNVDGEGWYFIKISKSNLASTLFKFTVYVTDADETYANVYDKFTIYIDDLTVDYSDATDDREIPHFTDVTVSTDTDNFVKMDGQTIDTNTVIVKAAAQEDLTGNYTGLDVTSAKVYVDGVQLDAEQYSCDNSGVITIPDITLPNGTHTFRFEIFDNSGNMGFTTKQIVVNADKGDVAVVRRNASTVQPLAGSIEYFDVVAQNAENIKSITMKLDLDSLSAWELQGANVLYGFDMSYSVDAISNTASITLTKNDKATATGETVIASLPVRVWQTTSYLNQTYIDAGLVNKTGAGEGASIWSPDIMWTTDRDRYVRIELNAESIVVTYTDETSATFSQKQINVITEHNRYRSAGYYQADGTYVTGDSTFVQQNKTSTHIHTVTNLDDKSATCTEAGYSGRTYCETCKSVVDWGTIIPATGHSYKVTEDVLKCDCGETFSGVYTDGKTYENGVIVAGWHENSYYVNGVKLTGVQKVDGYYYDFGENGVSTGKYTGLFYDETDKVYRYAQFGELSSGWKMIDDEWYYFRESTKAAPKKGYVYWSGIPYQFEETGKLISGIWVTTEEGTRYYYASSSYYRTVNTASVAFYTIDGKVYGFDRNGYIYKDGVYGLGESNQKELIYYAFDENGVRTNIIDFNNYSGIIKTTSGSMHYYVNGKAKQMGLIKIGDYFYYIRSGGVVATGTYYCTYNMTDLIPIGSYTFDNNGRMLNVPTGEKDGIVNENGTLYYYVDGVKQVNLGLIEIDDNGEKCYIYVRTAGQLAVGTYKVWINNDIVPYASEQDFGTDGKMKNAPVIEVKNGIVNENGTLYYYVDGVKQVNLGLIEIDDNGEKCYIYVRTAGQLAVGTYKVWINNDIVPYASEQDFGTDGKMKNAPVIEVKNGIVNENGTLYYYVDGVKQVNLGLIEIDDNGEKCYIYVRTAGQLAVGTYKVWINNDIVPYASAQVFNENGHMVVSQ